MSNWRDFAKLIFSFQIKKHQTYGKKLAVVLRDEGEQRLVKGPDGVEVLIEPEPENFLYFLAASYTEPKRVTSLDNLLKVKNGRTFMALEKVKIQGEMTIPCYRFVTEVMGREALAAAAKEDLTALNNFRREMRSGSVGSVASTT